MVFEFILKDQGIDPAKDLSINQSIDFGSTAAAFAGGQGDFTVVRGVNYTTKFIPARPGFFFTEPHFYHLSKF
ncbi:hypothetical protein SAMN02745243_02719 [Hespellia stercorisuis DSM 15480]|uniref:Uncharacterized protein n=1 Tax=Hespellia stercorisuis DSM 15480 TaxID=1121950 RepID=A0A1M6RKT8_9FIRM|nr:hypothetical protein SAMN02745243_02719 [Hespellia stercorisuis DSM 15480]